MPQAPLFEFLLLIVIVATIGFVIWYSLSQKDKKSEADSYLEALEFLAEGNDRLAIQKFKEAVHDNSENISAYLRLGDLLRKKELLNNAIRIHKDLTLRGNLTLDQQVRILKSLLLDYDLAGDSTEGIATANKILQIDRNPEVWVVQKLLEMLEKKQMWKEAEETANKFSKLLPSYYKKRVALYLVFQGVQLQKKGNGKEARIKFKEAFKKDAVCPAAYYHLGKSYREEQRLDDAVKAWKKLCSESPEKAYIVYPELEKAWFELGRYADAENLYQEQLSKSKKELNAGLALAEIYNKKGEYDHALEVLDRLEAEYQSSPVLVNKKVNLYFNKGQYKQAATHSLSLFKNENETGNSRYECEVCKHKVKAPTWVCPKCQSLDTYDI